jgi:hypothetical protein
VKKSSTKVDSTRKSLNLDKRNLNSKSTPLLMVCKPLSTSTKPSGKLTSQSNLSTHLPPNSRKVPRMSKPSPESPSKVVVTCSRVEILPSMKLPSKFLSTLLRPLTRTVNPPPPNSMTLAQILSKLTPPCKPLPKLLEKPPTVNLKNSKDGRKT